MKKENQKALPLLALLLAAAAILLVFAAPARAGAKAGLALAENTVLPSLLPLLMLFLMIQNTRAGVLLSRTLTLPAKALRLPPQAAGALLSFDPNIRPPLWDSMDRARDKMSYGCSVSDTVKIEIDELRFLTGCDDANKAVEIFGKRYPNVSLLTVTAGRNGSRAYYKDAYAEAPTFLNVKTIDTTGAGDTFCACCIDWFLNNRDGAADSSELKKMLVFANAAASLVTCKKGALLSMPEVTDINKLIRENETDE